MFARVRAITEGDDDPQGVHLELLPGDPLAYADALRPSHVLRPETSAAALGRRVYFL